MNGTWRERFLKTVAEVPFQIVVVRDANGFLTDPLFKREMDGIGQVQFCSTDLDIYRAVQRLDESERKLFLVLKPEKSIPYAIEKRASLVDLSIAKILPGLSEELLSECGTETFDALFRYYRTQTETPINPSKRVTKDFIIRAIFGVDPSSMSFESSLSFFIVLFVRKYRIPLEIIEDMRKLAFARSPLDFQGLFSSTPQEEQLMNCLSKAWFDFVNGSATKLSFENPDLFSSITLAISAGLIEKARVSDLESLQKLATTRPVALVGIEYRPTARGDFQALVEAKLEAIQSLLQEAGGLGSVQSWLNVAKQWGEIQHLSLIGNVAVRDAGSLSFSIESRFASFMVRRYDDLVTESTGLNPLTVDRILGYVDLQRDGGASVALVVFDGMGMAEWEIVREYLSKNGINIKRERQVYTMLPTLTNYSRQAIFSGKLPNQFIERPRGLREKSLFQQFWEARGLLSGSIFFGNVTPDKNLFAEGVPATDGEEFRVALEEQRPILGLVFNFIDKRLHGAYDLDVGKKLFHKSIQNFLQESCLADVFARLLKLKYRIFATSDHGNIVASGNGAPDNKFVAERQGKRCLIYDRQALAEDQERVSDVTLLRSRFLPSEQFVVFANGLQFFGPLGDKEITHGGISLEEGIVPFIEMF